MNSHVPSAGWEIGFQYSAGDRDSVIRIRLSHPRAGEAEP